MLCVSVQWLYGEREGLYGERECSENGGCDGGSDEMQVLSECVEKTPNTPCISLVSSDSGK